MNNNNLKPTDYTLKDSSLPRFKPTRRSSPETENSLFKMLDSVVNALEQSLGKRTYLCGNPDCGALKIFHSNGVTEFALRIMAWLCTKVGRLDQSLHGYGCGQMCIVRGPISISL